MDPLTVVLLGLVIAAYVPASIYGIMYIADCFLDCYGYGWRGKRKARKARIKAEAKSRGEAGSG
ncbi:hypothetical protein IMZ48_33315 [Candidatus Bathyarchaeota archaeon]|nr:hypothetical protein [Candidatus Bathyarchaeota archaeon]